MIVVTPPKVLAPVSLVTPAPDCVSAPAPEIALATVIESARLKVSVPLSTTAPAPSAPEVPPSPIWSVVAASTPVAPEKELFPVTMAVPVPVKESVPFVVVSEKTPEKVVVLPVRSILLLAVESTVKLLL